VKIAQINTFDYRGGAARAAYRLHKGLRTEGADCGMVVKFRSAPHDYVAETHAGNIAEAFNEAFYLSAIQRYYIDAHRTDLSNTIFSLPYPGIDISGLPEVREADIFNLHWVALYQSPVTLSKLFSPGKPVVWTLHDQWAFTGGCHYSAGCEKYSTDCSRCPQLADDPFDLAAAVLKDKLDLFRNADLTVVTPSRWLASCAKKSALFRNLRAEVIPNSLETDVFVPVPKAEAKEKLGMRADDIAILFGAEQGNEKRKGFHELVAAMEHCMTEPSFREMAAKGSIKIICFGNASPELQSIGLPVISLGYLRDDEKIREAYSAADLFVLPSLEDNLPNTMLESLSCSTPVVAFATGGIPDVVIEGETGMLAPTGDSAALGRAIASMVSDPTLRNRMGQTGRERMVEGYSLDVQAKRYLALYEDLLGKRSTAHQTAVGERPSQASASIDTALGASFGGIYDGVQIKSLREAAPAMQREMSSCTEKLKGLNDNIRILEKKIKDRDEQFRRKCEELLDKDKQFRAKCFEIAEKDETHQQVRREKERLEKELADARKRIDEMLNSWSWRITKPIRSMGSSVKGEKS
jgi:glycosyltransferase involved in cell wall biosynthesis